MSIRRHNSNPNGRTTGDLLSNLLFRKRAEYGLGELSTSDFQSEVGEVLGEIGGELLAKVGKRFSSFFCWGKSSEPFSTKTPPQISPSNFTTRFWVVAGPGESGFKHRTQFERKQRGGLMKGQSWRMCPRSGFWGSRNIKNHSVFFQPGWHRGGRLFGRNFGTGEHLPNPPFWKSPFFRPPISEFLDPHRVPRKELSEFCSAYFLCFTASSPSLPRNSASSLL